MRRFDQQAVPTEATESSAARLRSGWVLLANLILACLFFLQLHWYVRNIYAQIPWIPFLSPEQVNTLVDLLWGAVMLHIGGPLTKGQFEILRAPRRFLGRQALGAFGNWRTLAVTAGLAVGAYALVVARPALHLIHTEGEVRPEVEVDGTFKTFNGDVIILPGDSELLQRKTVIVADRNDLYRVQVLPTDAESYWPFVTHARVNLDNLFVDRDLEVTLRDSARSSKVVSFLFDRQSGKRLGHQCAEAGLPEHLGGDGDECSTLLRLMLDDIAGNPEVRLRKPSDGSVTHQRRAYYYQYEFGRTPKLSVQLPEARSDLANNPKSALDLYRSVGHSERDQLVTQFRTEVGDLSSAAQETMFPQLFKTENLYRYLTSGSTAQVLDALGFAREILALGLNHVPTETLSGFLALVFEEVLTQSPDEKAAVPALQTVIELSRGRDSLRAEVIRSATAFASELGQEPVSARTAVADVLLSELRDDMSASEAESIAAALKALFRRPTRSDPAVRQIKSRARSRVGKLSDSAVVRPVRRVLGL